MPELLTDEQIEAALVDLDVEWSAIPGQGLVRVFNTGAFADGVLLLGMIAEVADRHNHHPEARITHDEVEITLFTQDAGGVTQRDVELAKAIDEMYEK